MAITPDGRHAYITNRGSDTVSVVDTASNTVTATITIPPDPYPYVGHSYPKGVAITPDGRRAYITNFAGVSVVDTTQTT